MKRIALSLALIAGPLAAHAADAGLSYSWLEADYVHVNPDHADNANGVALRASGAISDNFNVVAGANRLNDGYGVAPFKVDDSRNYYLGIGYHVPVATNVDLVSELTYLKHDNNFDEDGYGAKVGVRAAVNANFEVGAGVAYAKLHHIDSNTALDVSAQYKFTPTFGVAAEALVGNHDRSFVVGPRLSF